MRRFLTSLRHAARGPGMVPFLLLLPALVLPASVAAQPTLDSLWPNEDGRRWSFEGTYEEPAPIGTTFLSATLTFNGTVPLLGGGTGQNLQEFTSVLATSFATSATTPGQRPELGLGQPPRHLRGFWRNLWRGRPDLREAIEHRFELQAQLEATGDFFWPWLLLSPGQFVKTSTRIGTWSEIEPDWGWWHLTDDLTPGATWTRQLIPSVADDIFLYGTVVSVSATVESQAGTFTNAVQMDYLVDQGELTYTNEEGDVLGTGRSEVSGTVYFVPTMGPVQLVEQFELVEWDCPHPDCPPDLEVGIITTGEMDLIQPPVATEQQSWGHVKALFGNE